MADIPQPWLADALELLDLRRKDRVLVFSAPTPAHVAAVRQSIGRAGRTVVIEPQRELAEELAARMGDDVDGDVEVLSVMPSGEESYGSFDACLACPLHTMGLPVQFWGNLFSHNLRPGGRFVLDLPGEEMSDKTARCWVRSGGEPEALANLRGPGKQDLAKALETSGLRNVSASSATHLVQLENPFVLAQLMAELSGTDTEAVEDFGRTLVEDLKTAVEVELALHRTRAHGLR